MESIRIFVFKLPHFFTRLHGGGKSAAILKLTCIWTPSGHSSIRSKGSKIPIFGGFYSSFHINEYKVFTECILLIFSGNIWATDKPNANFRILISRAFTWAYHMNESMLWGPFLELILKYLPKNQGTCLNEDIWSKKISKFFKGKIFFL